MRESGIDIIGSIPWGTHFCQFYKTKQELLDILVPYFEAGLQNNELCVWITAPPLSEKEAEKALSKAVPDFGHYKEKGQIEIIPHTGWYLKGGTFDARRVLNDWVEKHGDALKRGYDGLRVTGDTRWLEKDVWREFSDYEKEIERVIGEYRMLVLCTYSLKKCNAAEVTDVVVNHLFSLMKREGRWELIESLERKRVEEALRESEKHVRLKLDSILSPEGDIGSLELSDIIDAPAVQSLLENFYQVSHLPMAIIDLKGKVLVGMGWSRICTKFHRVHPETCEYCIESDTQLSAGVPPGEFRLYKCKNNMWDIATPIIVGGRHVGNVFSGQFFFEDEPLDYGFFRSQARRYGFDEAEYIAALEAVPRISRDFLNAGMAFLARLAHMLSQQSYSNIKLARSLAERDALTDSLRESEQRLNRSQEIAHLGSWELDLVDNKLTWSDEVYRIFGLKPREFGATYEAFIKAIHPDDRAAVDAAYSGSLREGRDSYEVEHRVVKPDGEVRVAYEKCEHFRDASGRIVRSVGMVQDITERKRAEEALRRAKDEWERTFDSVPDLIAIMDDRHRIVRANQAMAKRLGLTPQECAGQVCYFSVHGTDRPPDTCPHVLTLADGQEHEAEIHEDRLGGDFLVTTTPLADERGRMAGSVHIARDITARKAMERQKSDFLAMLTHDLKSPLTSIMGFAELILERESVNSNIASMVTTIQHSGQKLLRMVDDFLTVSRMEAGSLEMRFVAEDVRDLLSGIGEEFRPLAEQKGLRFAVEAGEDLPRPLMDKKHLERAVANLLQNAFNYTPSGGEVRLRAWRRDGDIAVSVRDTGPGVPAEERDRVFDKYYRSPKTAGIKGTGLGLAIVKAVAEAHGGRVELESEPGGGSVFSVFLPVRQAPPTPD